jgi:ParB family transcriptional regulator, chromosome partitioning protein
MSNSECKTVEIPVNSLVEPRHPLRSEFSRTEIIFLAQSIRDRGLLEPIVVRERAKGYEVIAGSRRLRAFRYLALDKIPCHVVTADDKEAYEISIIENVHHQSLNPIDEALAYKRYVEEFGYGSISALGARIGKSQEYISLRLALLRLPKEVLDKVICRQISATTAQELLPLSTAQQKRLAALAVERGLTKRRIRREVKILREENLQGVDWLKGTTTGNEENGRGSRKHKDDYFIDKSLIVLKASLLGLGDVIDSLPESSVLREILFEYRLMIHNQVNSLIKLKKKSREVTNLVDEVMPHKTMRKQEPSIEVESLALSAI